VAKIQHFTNEEITFSSQSLSSSLPSKNERTDVNRIIIVLVLCGCQNWSVKLRVEHRLWVFKNRAMRNMLGSKVDGGIGGWNKLHSDRFCDLYCLSNSFVMGKLRSVRCGVVCGEKGMHTILVRRRERKRLCE